MLLMYHAEFSRLPQDAMHTHSIPDWEENSPPYVGQNEMRQLDMVRQLFHPCNENNHLIVQP